MTEKKRVLYKKKGLHLLVAYFLGEKVYSLHHKSLHHFRILSYGRKSVVSKKGFCRFFVLISKQILLFLTKKFTSSSPVYLKNH